MYELVCMAKGLIRLSRKADICAVGPLTQLTIGRIP